MTVSGSTYAPTPTSQSKSVTAGTTATATITYALVQSTTGSLAVSSLGLPSGVLASITVTGPAGYSHSVTATQTLTGLTAGSYTVTAANVTSSGTTYTAQPASQTVTVSGGATASATITYSSPSGLPTLTPGFHARSFKIPDPTNNNAMRTFNYQIYIPQGYTPSRSWPVILTNHGSGEKGSDNQKQLGVGLGPHVAAVGERAVIVFPQEPVTSGNVFAVAQLLYMVEKGALDEALTAVNADLTRIYLTGNSAGAIRGWNQLYLQPTRFAAFFPASGEVDAPEILSNLAATEAAGIAAIVARFPTLPIHVYHGSADGTVDVSADRALAAAYALLPGSSATFKYIEYPGLDHGGTWDTAFADPAARGLGCSPSIPVLNSTARLRAAFARSHVASLLILHESVPHPNNVQCRAGSRRHWIAPYQGASIPQPCARLSSPIVHDSRSDQWQRAAYVQLSDLHSEGIHTGPDVAGDTH